jgi:purine-binding chemotaxis protein CheW
MTEDEVHPPVPESVPDEVLATIAPLEEADATPAPPPRERLAYLGFYVGQEVYGLPLGQLREVARLTRLRHIPGAPAGVAGLVNLRGEIVCAIDVRAILGLSAQAPADSAFLVALRDFDDPVGLIVDSIADIYSIDPGEIEPTPETWSPERRACFVGTIQVPVGMMGLLDVHRVVRT